MSAALRLDVPDPSRLSASLREAGMSYADFAKSAGVEERSVFRWAAGDAVPQPGRRARVAKALAKLGLSYGAVFGAFAAAANGPRKPPELRLVTTSPHPARARAGQASDSDDSDPTPPEETPPMPDRHGLELLDPEDMDHFQLQADPFEEAEPGELWLPPHLERLERGLLRAFGARRISALVAPAGSGKTTILRRVHAQALRSSKMRILFCSTLDRSQISHATLATAILRDLRGRDEAGRERDYGGMAGEARSELLRRTLDDEEQAGRLPILLIDEAHRMPNKGLIAIKELWDSAGFQRKLSVLLVGQSDLEDRLRKDPAVQELLGRTQILRLPALGEHVGDYLRWRFARVSADADAVFTPAAMKAIGTRAEHPMWVNNLAVLAMRYAALSGADIVDAIHVGRV